MEGIECVVPLISLSAIVVVDNVQVHDHDFGANLSGMVPELQNERRALEQEVAALKEKLMHEMELHEALKSGLQRSPGNLSKILEYIPTKTRDLLFEVAVLEDEVFFLEKHALYLWHELHDGIKPGLISSLQVDNGMETDTIFKRTIASEVNNLESKVSEPTTPNNSLTPFDTPKWRPSPLSSPSNALDENMSSFVPLDFSLPLSSKPPLPHADKSDSLHPPVLNKMRVIKRGSSSSQSVPADTSELYNVYRKPSRKTPNHKKSQSLPDTVRKKDVECDSTFARSLPVNEVEKDVYKRLPAPKKGVSARSTACPSTRANPDKFKNIPLKWSTNGKEVQRLCRIPPRFMASQDEKVDSHVKRSMRKKELLVHSPPLTSEQLETKRNPYFRHSSSFKEMEIECSLASTLSRMYDDKVIAPIKLITSSMSPTRSPQLKVYNCKNLSNTSSTEQRTRDQLVTPFKLPATVEKKNVKILTSNYEQQRTHDLFITSSLPPIKLNMASKLPSPQIVVVRHRQMVPNNFSKNAKLYAKVKMSTIPMKKDFIMGSNKDHMPLYKGDNFEQKTSKLVELGYSKHQPGNDDFNIDKDDKVGMAYGPIANASWLPDDLARLFGKVCSKIWRHNLASDSIATKTTAKPHVPLVKNSQSVPSFARSQSFDIRSQEGLQMLEEYCSDGVGLLDFYEIHKHGSENLGPHRHYYKAMKPPLELKLKA